MNIIRSIVSADKTKKYFFQLNEQSDTDFRDHVEACLLYLQRHGDIICVSSQVGCVQSCSFCASGLRPFIRNLTSDEIQEQVRLIIEDNPKFSNCKFQITYMGSGEPLSNWDAVFSSIDCLRERYSNLEKVNISTIWPTDALKRFKALDWSKYKDFLHFQFSLHFPNDKERNMYFRAKLPSILESIDSLEYISQLINDVYRINYIPFDGLNDSDLHIKELAEVMEHTENAVLKVSEMCTIQGCTLMPSRIFDVFVEKIKLLPYPNEVFKSDGTDIHAGCGQLYNDSII